MPRIRQYADKYAEADFWKEVQIRKVMVGINTDKDLSQAIGLWPSGYSKRKKDVNIFTLAEFRLLIKTLKPGPMVVLRMLGYSQKEIQNDFRKEELKL